MKQQWSRVLTLSLVALALLPAAACNPIDTSAEAPVQRVAQATPSPAATTAAPVEESKKRDPVNQWVTRRPSWLGTRVLERAPGGFGVVQPTPLLLRNRRFATVDILPPPDDKRFAATVDEVPGSVVARSTWRPRCPVGLGELSYVKMTFWGFDHRPHTGEMITNASVAEQLVGVFRALYQARFPIEEMRVVSRREQRRWRTHPTGDTNVTSSFECRQATGGSSWSMHAFGLAVDINPFHNPYLNGELVGPELAGAYTDRTWKRPGMILEGDAVTRAFDSIGWEWGGRWRSLKDWMHFSQNGR